MRHSVIFPLGQRGRNEASKTLPFLPRQSVPLLQSLPAGQRRTLIITSSAASSSSPLQRPFEPAPLQQPYHHDAPGPASPAPPVAPRPKVNPFRIVRSIALGGAILFILFGWENDSEDAEVLKAALAELDALQQPRYLIPEPLPSLASSSSSPQPAVILSQDPTGSHAHITERLPSTGEELVTKTFDVMHEERVVHACLMYKKGRKSSASNNKPAIVLNCGTVATARPLALALRRRDPDLTIISYTHAGLVGQSNVIHWGRPETQDKKGKGSKKPQGTPERPPQAQAASAVSAVPLTALTGDGSNAELTAAALDCDGVTNKSLPIGEHPGADISDGVKRMMKWSHKGRPWDEWLKAQQATAAASSSSSNAFDPVRQNNPLAPHLLAPTLCASQVGDDNPLFASFFTPPVTAPDALATSDWESSELSAVLAQAARIFLQERQRDEEEEEAEAFPAGVILIANHHNWLATVKTAIRNPDRVKGLVLLDPQLPTFSPYLGVHTGTSATASTDGTDDKHGRKGASTTGSSLTAIDGKLQVTIGAPVQAAARPQPIFTPAPFLLELPPHRALPPGVLKDWSAASTGNLGNGRSGGGSDNGSGGNASSNLKGSRFDADDVLALDSLASFGYYLTDRLEGIEPLSGSQLMDACVTRQLIAGSALGPLGCLPSQGFLKPGGGGGSLEWIDAPPSSTNDGAFAIRKKARRLLARSGLGGPTLVPTKRWELGSANPFDGHGKRVPLRSPFLHFDLVAAGSQLDVNKIWFPFYETGEGMKGKRRLMLEATGQAVGAAIHHHTHAAFSRVQAGVCGGGAIQIARAVAQDYDDQEGQQEQAQAQAAALAQEPQAEPEVEDDGDGDGDIIHAPCLYSTGSDGVKSVICAANPSTDEVLSFEESSPDHLAISAIVPTQGFRVNFSAEENAPDAAKQEELSLSPDLLAVPVSSQLDLRYQYVQSHLDAGLSENFLHSLTSNLMADLVTAAPPPMSTMVMPTPEAVVSGAVKKIRVLANALGLMKGDDPGPMLALRKKAAGLAAKTRPVAFGTVPLDDLDDDDSGLKLGGDSSAPVHCDLLTAEQKAAFANVMVTALAALAFPDSRFATAQPLLSDNVGALKRRKGRKGSSKNGGANGGGGWWFGGGSSSKNNKQKAAADRDGQAVLLAPSALLLGCNDGLEVEDDATSSSASSSSLVVEEDSPSAALKAMALEAALRTPPQMALTLSHAGVDLSRLVPTTSPRDLSKEDEDDAAREGNADDDDEEEDKAERDWTVDDAARALSRRLLHSPGAWLLPIFRVSLARCLAALALDVDPLKYREPSLDALEREILRATDALVADCAEDEDGEGVVEGALLDAQDKALADEFVGGKRLLALSAMPTFHGRASLLTGKPGRQSSDFLIVNSFEDALHGLALRRATLEPYRLQLEPSQYAVPPQLLMKFASLVDSSASPGDVGREVDLNNPREPVALKAANLYSKALKEAEKFEEALATKLAKKMERQQKTQGSAGKDKNSAGGVAPALPILPGAASYRCGAVTNTQMAIAKASAAALIPQGLFVDATTGIAQQYKTSVIRRIPFRSSIACRGLSRFVEANLADAPFPLRVILTQQTERRAKTDPLLGPPQVLMADAHLFSSIGAIGKVPQEMRLALLSKKAPPGTVAARVALGLHQAQMRDIWSRMIRPRSNSNNNSHNSSKVLVVAPETGAEVQASLRAASALLKAGTTSAPSSSPSPSSAEEAVRTLLLKNDGSLLLGGRWSSDPATVAKEGAKLFDLIAVKARGKGAASGDKDSSEAAASAEKLAEESKAAASRGVASSSSLISKAAKDISSWSESVAESLEKQQAQLKAAAAKKDAEKADQEAKAAAKDGGGAGVPSMSGLQIASTKPPPVFLLDQDAALVEKIGAAKRGAAGAGEEDKAVSIATTTSKRGPVPIPVDALPVVSGAAFSDALTIISDALAYGSAQPYRPPLSRVVSEVLDLVNREAAAQREASTSLPLVADDGEEDMDEKASE